MARDSITDSSGGELAGFAGYILATSSMHGCNSENRSYHGFGIDFVIQGQRVSVKLRSTDFPDVQPELEEALKARALRGKDGISKEDTDFATARLLPALAEVPTVTDEIERERLISRARGLWKDYLMKVSELRSDSLAPQPAVAPAAAVIIHSPPDDEDNADVASPPARL